MINIQWIIPKKPGFNLYQSRHCAYITHSVKTWFLKNVTVSEKLDFREIRVDEENSHQQSYIFWRKKVTESWTEINIFISVSQYVTFYLRAFILGKWKHLVRQLKLFFCQNFYQKLCWGRGEAGNLSSSTSRFTAASHNLLQPPILYCSLPSFTSASHPLRQPPIIYGILSSFTAASHYLPLILYCKPFMVRLLDLLVLLGPLITISGIIITIYTGPCNYFCVKLYLNFEKNGIDTLNFVNCNVGNPLKQN